MTKDATLRAIDEMVADLAAQDGDDFAAAEEMVRTAGLDVVYKLAAAALIGSARSKRRRLALETERRHQSDARPAHEDPTVISQRQKWESGKAEREAEWAREDAAIHARYLRSMERALDTYTAQVRMKWEADLLASTFNLGDGTAVTWGEATVAQHAERAAMFKRNVEANAEGYARHQRAIDDIEASGFGTLNEMVRVAA